MPDLPGGWKWAVGIQAAATLALVVITGYYAYQTTSIGNSTEDQAKATRDLADVAQQQFAIANRPLVIPISFETTSIGSGWEVRVALENINPSAAKDVNILFCIESGQPDGSSLVQRQKGARSIAILPLGSSKTISIRGLVFPESEPLPRATVLVEYLDTLKRDAFATHVDLDVAIESSEGASTLSLGIRSVDFGATGPCRRLEDDA